MPLELIPSSSYPFHFYLRDPDTNTLSYSLIPYRPETVAHLQSSNEDLRRRAAAAVRFVAAETPRNLATIGTVCLDNGEELMSSDDFVFDDFDDGDDSDSDGDDDEDVDDEASGDDGFCDGKEVEDIVERCVNKKLLLSRDSAADALFTKNSHHIKILLKQYHEDDAGNDDVMDSMSMNVHPNGNVHHRKDAMQGNFRGRHTYRNNGHLDKGHPESVRCKRRQKAKVGDIGVGIIDGAWYYGVIKITSFRGKIALI